jgi:hypothetical protein
MHDMCEILGMRDQTIVRAMEWALAVAAAAGHSLRRHHQHGGPVPLDSQDVLYLQIGPCMKSQSQAGGVLGKLLRPLASMFSPQLTESCPLCMICTSNTGHDHTSCIHHHKCHTDTQPLRPYQHIPGHRSTADMLCSGCQPPPTPGRHICSL